MNVNGSDAMNIKEAVRTLIYKNENKRSYHQLYTEWGEKLNKEEVLQEYPRPQLKRNSYFNLNGYWNYEITHQDQKPSKISGQILVPFSPESVLSGVNRQLQPGEYLWYEKTLLFDHIDEDKRCILHFGAVDQCCELWINERKIVRHVGGYLPFEVDITDHIHQGENLITLCVTDISDTSYYSKGKQKLERGGMFYTAQSGIWQTVWYEWVPKSYMKMIKLTPDIDQDTLLIEVTAAGDTLEQSQILYQVQVYDGDILLQSISSDKATITMKMKDYETWSPENPKLYQLLITMGEDQIESYFGMRKYEIKKDEKGIARVYLNNHVYFQNGLLDQGYWPDGLYTAPSDEALIYDIEKSKELGFNMLRKHIKIEPLRWYYHCDRLGMIVWQDMVNGGERYNMLIMGYIPTLFTKLATHIKDKWYKTLSRNHEVGRNEWLLECDDTVSLLYNAPCISTWVPFNEGWGQFDAKKVYWRIKALDQTRLIDHASGWFDQGEGDFKSIHNYFRRLRVKVEKRPVIFSEFGGYACYVKDHSYSWRIYGYRIYNSPEELNKAYQKLYSEEINALIEQGLCAAVYTQLSDVEDEVNGVLTYDRKVCKVEPLQALEKN